MKTIISKGVMRSGNVLLRLILNHIFNESNAEGTHFYNYRFFAGNVNINSTEGIKNMPDPNLHGYENIPMNNILVIPWRDPRDSIISYIRTEFSKTHTDKFPTKEYILENCKKTANEQMEVFENIIKMSNQHPKNNLLELKYEKFHNNFYFLYDKFEEFFKIKLHVIVKENIIRIFNKKETINHQKQFPNFNTFDNTSWVHGDHVYQGDNNWKEVLTPEMLDIINPILDPYIKKWESL